MAGAKEIRTKIKSIQNTQKITKAMEMVAASKMRRAQEAIESARPYAEQLDTILRRLQGSIDSGEIAEGARRSARWRRVAQARAMPRPAPLSGRAANGEG